MEDSRVVVCDLRSGVFGVLQSAIGVRRRTQPVSAMRRREYRYRWNKPVLAARRGVSAIGHLVKDSNGSQAPWNQYSRGPSTEHV